jgi:hypothetical protein
LSSTRFRIRWRLAFWALVGDFSDERILQGELKLTGAAGRDNSFLRANERKFPRHAGCYSNWRLSMRACRPFASISGARNSRLPSNVSRCTGHDRRHPSLVGPRRLCPKMGAENCSDRRATRRTRFSRTKAICGWQRTLPRLPALSRDASSTGATKLYT